MKTFKWQNICLILLVLVVIPGFAPNQTSAAEDHVPDGITMQEEFKPGFGEPLGIFKKTIGKVLLIHSSDTLGYWTEKDLPLYMKDTIITPEGGLALLQFLDESTISVAEDSELIINRFIFDPDKFDRSTFLNLNTGKARFWVKKLKGYTRSEFKVKTKTLIAGVRGSDFVIEAGPDYTEVIALDDTVLEIISLGAPNKIIVLRAFEKIRVGANGEVSPIEKISPAEAAKLRNDLPMPFDRDVLDAARIFETEGTVDPDAKDKKLSKTRFYDPGTQILQVGDGTIILIHEEELEDPEPPADDPNGDQPPEIDWYAEALPGNDPEILQLQGQEILEDGPIQDEIIDDFILVPLPGPPPGP